MRIFEHNFVADKAKIRRRAAARQGFLTQYAAKFAEKTCAYAYEDRFFYIKKLSAADRFKRPYPTIFLNAFPRPVKKTVFNDAKVTDLAVSDTLLPQETPAAMYVTQNLFRPRCHRGRR